MVSILLYQPEYKSIQEALCTRPAIQDSLARLALETSLPRLATAMEAAAATAASAVRHPTAAQQKNMADAYAMAAPLGEVVLVSALWHAVQRHASKHGSIGLIRCIVQVVNAVPLRCPAGLLPGVYPNMLARTSLTAGMLASVSWTAGSDSNPPRLQHAAARELVRLLPHAVALLRIAAADVELQPQLSQLLVAMYNVLNSTFFTACLDSHRGNASETAICTEAIEAALSLLPLLEELDVVAGLLSCSGGVAPQTVVFFNNTSAAHHIGTLLTLASNSMCMALTGAAWMDDAPAVVASGFFDAIVQLHTRAARLLCWLAARCDHAALAGACSTEGCLPGCANQLLCVILNIVVCADRQAVDGCEKR
jgi:hypothetical protein